MTSCRPFFALLLGLGFLAACSAGGSSPSTLLPQSGARGAMLFGVGGGGIPTPAPLGAMKILAPVDLTVAPLSTFALTNPGQCFGASAGDDEEGHSAEHHWEHGNHYHRGNSDGAQPQQYGTPYTPSSLAILSFGAFSLTNPCAAPAGNSGRGEDSGMRRLRNIVPVPTGSGAFIVAQDSADPAHLMINVDGPASDDGTTYSFPMQRFGRPFLAGHTYTFALAVPGTPAPSPTPAPAHHGHGNDD